MPRNKASLDLLDELKEEPHPLRRTPAASEFSTRVGANRCALLDARPDANITPQQASDFVQRVVDGFDHLREALNTVAEQHGQQALDAHRRVRAAARMTGVRYAVQPQLPPDVLGIYVLLPILGAARP